MREVIEVWERIEALVPASTLAPAASEAEIRAAEERIGITFPAQVRASYLRHNGTTSYDAGFLMHSLEQVAPAYEEMVEDYAGDCPGDCAGPRACTCQAPQDADVQPYYSWYPGWIPLCYEPDGSVVGVDTTPGPAGTVGQILYADQGFFDHVSAPDWVSWLGEEATRLAEPETA